jgi:choline dehydrogenase-like flavoprotein
LILQVGQHLYDKPLFLTAINFNPGFELGFWRTFANIAATTKIQVGTMGEERTLLYEPVSSGVPGAELVLAFEKSLFPTTLRDGPLAELASKIIRVCSEEKLFKTPLCAPFLPLRNAGCLATVASIAAMVSDPSSEGNVTLGPKGELHIDCNYLSNREDVEALGAHLRSSFNILTSMTGPSAPQQPCDKEDGPSCPLQTCPDIFKLFLGLLASVLSVLNPKGAEDIAFLKDVPPSAVFPPSIEWGINQGLTDYEIGQQERTGIISPHHFTGTARFGSVIDTRFKVKGTEGLYVADASALPRTTRGNTGATTMAIGRLAGVSTLEES